MPGFPFFVPVGLGTGVAALLAKGTLVCVHLETVEGEEESITMDQESLKLMGLDQVIISSFSSEVCLLRQLHETKFCIDVFFLLGLGQIGPRRS